MNEHELNAGLGALLQERTRLADVSSVHQQILATPIEQMPQQRRWALPSPKWRFQSMFSATKFVVAGVIVALFGGFLLAGVLSTPSDEQLPAVGASASTQADPTDAVTAEPTKGATEAPEATTPDLLAGVDLVTEEVEPRVYRVMSDGVRDLVRLPDPKDRWGGIHDGNVVAGLDGSVWWFDPDGFFRLGQDAGHRWPKGISENFRPGLDDIEVGPDGTLWLTAGFGAPGKNFHRDISSYDGEAWSIRWRETPRRRLASGVEVQQDGTVWMAWWTEKGDLRTGPLRAARLGDDGWEVLPGSVEADGRGDFDAVAVAEGGGSDVWLTYFRRRLYHHDGEGWVRQQAPGRVERTAVGPDGTLWVQLNAECDPKEPCSDPLARLDGGEWEIYDSSGIPMTGAFYQGFGGFFEVAPDRSIWVQPNGDHERTGTQCDGLANFDGEAVAYFLRDMCIYAMDIAPDGTVWLQAGEYRADIASGQGLGDVQPGPIHTYVITPEAVAVTESQ